MFGIEHPRSFAYRISCFQAWRRPRSSAVQSVSDDRLLIRHNWSCTAGLRLARYSTLDQIARHVAELSWSEFTTGLREGHQAPPVVNDGYMYVTTPQNHVLALNAATGELLWRHVRFLPDDLQQMHPTNRGVALYGDRVYMATVDAYLVSLDALTGEVIWEVLVEDY